MRVAIYYGAYDFDHNLVMKLHDWFPADSLYEARRLVKHWFEIEKECAEWNIRRAWVSQTYVEAHIYGFTQDEQVAIVLEDDAGFTYLDAEWWINEME